MSHIAKTWLAHRTQRYHTNMRLAHIGQTNADHSHGVATLCALLFPDASADLLRACLLHDAGEWKAGDLPQPFKAANPDLAKEHRNVEAGFAKDITGIDVVLSPREQSILKLCDSIEAILFAAFHRPKLLDRADWRGFVDAALRASSGLGVYGPVGKAIDDIALDRIV